MKNPKLYIFLTFLMLLVWACKKDNSSPSLEKVKYNNNKKTYPNNNMDSAQAINAITRQKVQEVLDLSILYSSGKKDTEIDSAVYSQILGYFHDPDSLTLAPLMKELDSFQVRRVKVSDFQVYEKIHNEDTLNYAGFQVEYFSGQNRFITKQSREAQYILVSSPKQFKKEFKFYFLNFYNKSLKDSTSVGVTK